MSESKTKANRLLNETSTYLLQHAYNPVDWYPWSQEAISTAQEQDKPILLSVGYSACHWCHVMEHESFEDEETATIMNKLFVCIKVDREERPDIDDIYMKAVQMLTGHGGWPMTVFLTPELKPFFGGTYYPPEDRHGLPSFKRLLLSIARAWREQREEITESSNELTNHLAMVNMLPPSQDELNSDQIEKSINRLWGVFDKECGGFGGAPKFPHTGSIALCLRASLPSSALSEAARKQALEMATKTLDQMAWGGIHDQLAGGFSRYAVDRIWLVPHFEKMLYDNALLCRNYFEGYQRTGNLYWRQVGKGILDFVLNELTTDEGAFYSSLDADSEGEEGRFYVWTPEQITAVLGKEDGKWLSEVFDCHDRGNFEHGTTVLHLAQSPETLAKHYKMTVDAFWQRLAPLRAKLLEERSKRVRPGRDEKVLTSWNSLMVSAFIDGYRCLQDIRYLNAAKRTTKFMLESLTTDGGTRLLRTWGRGIAKFKGYLDDYAYFIQALLDLAQVDTTEDWLSKALVLNDVMLEQFSDAKDGTFFFVSDEHESLITQPKSYFDASMPSPTAVATMNLLRLGRLTANETFVKRAENVLKVYSSYYDRAPDQFSYLLCCLDLALSAPSELVLIAPDSTSSDTDDNFKAMLFAAQSVYLPHTVALAFCPTAAHTKEIANLPLLAGRESIEGKTTAYYCVNFACQKPVTLGDELTAILSQSG